MKVVEFLHWTFHFSGDGDGEGRNDKSWVCM